MKKRRIIQTTTCDKMTIYEKKQMVTTYRVPACRNYPQKTQTHKAFATCSFSCFILVKLDKLQKGI